MAMSTFFGFPSYIRDYMLEYGDTATVAFVTTLVANTDNSNAKTHYQSVLTRLNAVLSATFPTLTAFAAGSITDKLLHPKPQTIPMTVRGIMTP